METTSELTASELKAHVDHILEPGQIGHFQQCLCSKDRRNAGIGIVRQIVDHSPESVVFRNLVGAYPIHIACCLGELEVVEYLASVVATSTAFVTDMGMLPLHLASYFGCDSICKFLLGIESGQVSSRTTNGILPEDAATLGGHESLADMLAQMRLHQEECTHIGDTMLVESDAEALKNNVDSTVEQTAAATAATSPQSGLEKYISPSKTSQAGSPPIDLDGANRPGSSSIKTRFTLPCPAQLLDHSVTSETNDYQQHSDLLGEFQRASLLEEEGDRYEGPSPGGKHGNLDPPALEDSLMFNLSEDILPVEHGRNQHLLPSALHNNNQNNTSNNNNDATMAGHLHMGQINFKQQQERDARSFREFIHGTRGQKHATFMFDNSFRKRNQQSNNNNRPSTGKTSHNPSSQLNIISDNYEPRAASANATSPGDKASSSNSNTRRCASGGSPKQTVFHSVPLHHEVSVPGIIITTAAVQQSSPNMKQRHHREFTTTSAAAAAATATKRGQPGNIATSASAMERGQADALHLNESNTWNSVMSIEMPACRDASGAAAGEVPEQVVYTLCKPLRPTSPRNPTRSAVRKSPHSTRKVRSPSEPGTGTTKGARAATKSSASSNRNKQEKEKGQRIHEEIAFDSLANRRLQGKAAAQQVDTFLQESPQPPKNKDKELIVKRRWSQRAVRPVLLFSDDLEAASEENKAKSNPTHAGFVPSKVLRAKITVAELMSPAKQNKIDLSQMAQDAIRVAEDPSFIPTIQPVHYTALDADRPVVKPRIPVPAPAVPRAQMYYEMFASHTTGSAAPSSSVPAQRQVLHVIPQAVIENAPTLQHSP